MTGRNEQRYALILVSVAYALLLGCNRRVPFVMIQNQTSEAVMVQVITKMGTRGTYPLISGGNLKVNNIAELSAIKDVRLNFAQRNPVSLRPLPTGDTRSECSYGCKITIVSPTSVTYGSI